MNNKIVVSVPDDELYEALSDDRNISLVRWDLNDKPPLDEIDIVVPAYLDGVAPLANLAGVKTQLVQWQMIGFEGAKDFLPSGTVFANAASVHEASTAELAIGLALASQRDIVKSAYAKSRHEWIRAFTPSFADRKVLIVGYGGVSKAIEARLAGFEVEITRVATRARTELNNAGDRVPVHGIDELETLLPQAEIVFVGLPLTSSTQKIFNKETLALMQDDALIVNVGRGGLVDTGALVDELQSGRLRAALDVVDPEPLPADHPLWECEGLVLTPHVGGATSAMIPRVVKLVRRQVQHLVNEAPFENVVFD